MKDVLIESYSMKYDIFGYKDRGTLHKWYQNSQCNRKIKEEKKMSLVKLYIIKLIHLLLQDI